MRMPSRDVVEALAVTAELTRTDLTPAGARIFAADLAAYPEAQVLAALNRCRREVRSNLTPADVIGRLDDGRPTPEEAWAMVPRSEAETVVWTEEMAQAWAIAQDAGDRQSARMAFLAAYRRLVQHARDAGTPPRWTPSLGHDPRGREQALEHAVRLGRIPAQQAARIAPCEGINPAVLEATETTIQKLTDRSKTP